MLIVRVTTRSRVAGSTESALGTPGPAELRVRLVDHDDAGRDGADRLDRRPADRAVPVGLFGEVRITTDGARLDEVRWPRGRSIVKSLGPVAGHPPGVGMSRAYSGYIEYVGANDTAVRPGPPKASSSCSMTLVRAVGRPRVVDREPAPPSVFR